MSTKKTKKKSTKRSTKRKKAANSSKKKSSKKTVKTYRLGKTSLLFLMFIAVFLAIGSAYTQQRIKKILKQQAFSSQAIVSSRPFAIAPGVRPGASRIGARLKRLRYAVRDEKPSRPGQAKFSENSLDIYIREFTTPDARRQPARLINATIDNKGRISKVVDIKAKTEIPVAWLEPETLSLLGSSESRATTPTTLADTSPWLVKALVAIEDERFYQHFGVDPVAITRALVVNLKSGTVRQGGSTLTQQLAKNLFYGSQRTLSRKAKEAIAAILIETSFSKEQILEMYLNEIFLGQEGRVAIHGFGEAALSFFNKDVADLNISEAATLVGIIKAPSFYSPKRHPTRAINRRDVVLAKMLELNLLTKKQYLRAKDTPLNIRKSRPTRRFAPYYVDYLRSVLSDVVPLDELSIQPIQIHSGIDVEYQICANKAVTQGLASIEKKYPRLKKAGKALEAALVSVSPATGEFVAWIGGRNYSQNQFEHISLAARQTGSVFKPIVYLTALDPELNDYRTAKTTSLLIDEPITLEPVSGKIWEPKNYDNKFNGDVTFRHALVKSLNVPAVQLIQKVGVENVVKAAHRLGIKRSIPEVPAIALGAAELSPLEVARVYATIANGGRLANFRPILSITKNGQKTKSVFKSPLRDTQRVSEAASFVLTDLLASAIDSGTGRSVRRNGYKGAAAGKTGTTNDARDSWFAGYTPRLLTVVWVGFDDNSKTGLTGGQAAAPIWTSYMKCVSEMEPELEFVAPPGVVYRKIDISSGDLAGEFCENEHKVTEIFVEGTEPTSVCSIHDPGYQYAQQERRGTKRARIQRDRSQKRKSFIKRIFENFWR